MDAKGSLLKTSMQMMTEYCYLHPEKGKESARGVGRQFGAQLVEGLQTPMPLGSVISRFSIYWRKNGVGDLGWKDRKKRHLRIGCDFLPVAPSVGGAAEGRTFCPFTEGLLEAALRSGTGRRFEVRESVCGVGKERVDCIFAISERS